MNNRMTEGGQELDEQPSVWPCSKDRLTYAFVAVSSLLNVALPTKKPMLDAATLQTALSASSQMAFSPLLLEH